MKGFDVLKIKSAVKTRSKMDLSRTHLTTMDFGQIVPLLSEETVPGDKFNISADFFSRMAPLVKPTYGKFSFKTVSAFVPYHQVAVDAEAWLTGKTTWEGVTPHHRYITMWDLFLFIINNCLDYVGVTSSNVCFKYTDSSGVAQAGKFTAKGAYFVKVLNALGYALPQGCDMQTTSSWYVNVKDRKLSAYPLLAFFKLYNDYMSQSQRFNSSALTSFLYDVKYNVANGYWNSTNGNIYSTGIKVLFDNLFLNYENDYFVSAWQEPNNSLGTGESINVSGIPSSTPAGGIVASTNGDNFITQAIATTSMTLGQRSLDFLRSFDDWVRRNNYSGSRAVQQVYSRFGIKSDDYKSHYANVLSTDVLPVQVGDVTATADATGVPLGDYAGKGIMSGNKNLDIQVSDYGMIFILGYFTVAPMNAFGFDSKVLRADPYDYYTPEFDGIGACPITLGEFYANPIADATDTTKDTDIFGFTERYNSYRYGRDQITGEFRNYHPDGDMNTWHTGRNLNAIRAAGNLVAQSSSVNTLPQSDSEYNRIFSVTSGTVDHFYMTARFKVDAIRPMLNLNQVVNLGEGDTAVPRNGNVIA